MNTSDPMLMKGLPVNLEAERTRGWNLRRGAQNARSSQHGESAHAGNTTEYRIWHGIVQRCCNPRDRAYKWYGARGIGICDRWRFSYLAFLFDVGRRPSSSLSLDRIDNNGGYEPQNVRWATKLEQVLNSRAVRRFVYGGRSMTLTEWAQEIGLPRNVVQLRMAAGWPVGKALTTPLRITRKSRG